MFPTTQFAYQKGLGTCDTLSCLAHTLQSALESGQEARFMQIDFSAAFDRVNYQGFLYIGSALWFCDLSTDTVSVKPITACYGGWLPE